MDLPALKPSGFLKLIDKTADIAVLLDAKNRIADVSMVRSELALMGCERWLGKAMTDVVTPESVGKIQELIQACREDADSHWRHVNHPVPGMEDMAIQYIGMPLDKGQVLLMGRDMQSLALLQRRLVETQQSMERDFVRLRHVESRYRILLDTSREPVMLIDANTDKVSEANIAAQALARDHQRRLVGRDVLDCFEESSRDVLKAALRMAMTNGRIEMCRATPLGSSAECSVSCVMFRQENSVGDGHAVQGDGEVCLTALETCLKGRFRIVLHRKALSFPRAITPTHYITLGMNVDLDDAAQQALKLMIDWLVDLKGWDPEEAYVFCSLACDLHVTQLVDGNKGIHAMVSRGILGL